MREILGAQRCAMEPVRHGGAAAVVFKSFTGLVHPELKEEVTNDIGAQDGSSGELKAAERK